MSTHNRLTHWLAIAGVFATAVASGSALAQAAKAPQAAQMPPAHYGFGKIASPEEIAGWNIDVRPDGTGLPPGSGTVEQGKALYTQLCLACHGENGKGASAAALVGGDGTLNTPKPVRTIGSFWPYASTVYDYIHRAMPWDKPQSLKPDEVYALTAMLLNANKIIPDDAVMDAQSLPKVQMPNQKNFKPAKNKENMIPGVRCMKGC